MDFDLSDEDAFEGPDMIISDDGEVEDSGFSHGSFSSTSEGIPRNLSEPTHRGRLIRLAFGDMSYLNVRRLLRLATDDDEGLSNDEDGHHNHHEKSRTHSKLISKKNEPQEAGLNLLMSGEFGPISNKAIHHHKRTNISKLVTNPPARFSPKCYKANISNHLVPNSNGTAVAVCNCNIYSGQFSTDSSLYYTCAQDFRLRVYDTKAAPISTRDFRDPTTNDQDADHNHKSLMKVTKTIQGHPGRWTITDSHLSPDHQRIIYSSITPTVYMANISDSSTTQIPIPFSDPAPPWSRDLWSDVDGFGIWSCRFSSDGNEVIAGGAGNLFVYDLLANRRTVRIRAHEDDVNSCCWADTASGNVLISASDDTFLKVWDRRSLGSSQKPSGVLIGHVEGITHVSAKGDGRYVISNGKDQALRLWDLRKMRSNGDLDAVAKDNYRTDFDYRYERYPKVKYSAHPKDCSVMTYRGHSVLRTLIRCYFSPSETTGAQYLYSGSADGKIHIWSLDGRVVEVLDRTKTPPMSVDLAESGLQPSHARRAKVCVRDVSWHSWEPVIMSTGWENTNEGSIVARHEWKGLSKMHGSLEDWVTKRKEEQEVQTREPM